MQTPKTCPAIGSKWMVGLILALGLVLQACGGGTSASSDSESVGSLSTLQGGGGLLPGGPNPGIVGGLHALRFAANLAQSSVNAAGGSPATATQVTAIPVYITVADFSASPVAPSLCSFLDASTRRNLSATDTSEGLVLLMTLSPVRIDVECPDTPVYSLEIADSVDLRTWEGQLNFQLSLVPETSKASTLTPGDDATAVTVIEDKVIMAFGQIQLGRPLEELELGLFGSEGSGAFDIVLDTDENRQPGDPAYKFYHLGVSVTTESGGGFLFSVYPTHSRVNLAPTF